MANAPRKRASKASPARPRTILSAGANLNLLGPGSKGYDYALDHALAKIGGN
jgi:hypothetical protein